MLFTFNTNTLEKKINYTNIYEQLIRSAANQMQTNKEKIAKNIFMTIVYMFWILHNSSCYKSNQSC